MSEISDFKLLAGVYIPDVSALGREYRVKKSEITLSLSAEDYAKFFREGVKLLSEPVFFFVEIPSDDDKMRTYYLDNCTVEVAQAILKRYGGILFADGVIRFGFGSHSSEDEIYMCEYQTVKIYAKDTLPFEGLLGSLGYKKNNSAVLAWDIICEQNPGECVNVEADGEGYYDMVNNLIDIGMYPAK